MARRPRERDPDFNDYRDCDKCGREYSADELYVSNKYYFEHPYNYSQGCHQYCLACWIGVGPIDFPDWPTIILQALLVPGEKTSEGQLIEAVRPIWVEIIPLVRNDPDAIFEIPPRKLEELIAGAYE